MIISHPRDHARLRWQWMVRQVRSRARPIMRDTLIRRLGTAHASLARAYVLHVAWLLTMCMSAGLQWQRSSVEVSVLLTLLTVPPVLFYTIRVHHLCRRIDPAAATVGWVTVLVATFVLSPFESGLILPARNLLVARRILRAHQTSVAAMPTAEEAPGEASQPMR